MQIYFQKLPYVSTIFLESIFQKQKHFKYFMTLPLLLYLLPLYSIQILGI